MYRELKERLQYWVDSVFARGSAAQLALVVLFFLLAMLFGMSAYFMGLFSPANKDIDGISRKMDNGGLWDTWWWSLKHLFDPSFFYQDQGATWPIIAVSLTSTILGMAIFATLIGFISSAIDTRLESLRKGNSSVKERDHILILGWSNKVASVLNLLAQYRERLKVVILAPRDVEQMQEALRVEGAYDHKMKIILRSGYPSSFSELRRVAFQQAHSVIVLSYRDESHEASDPDIEAIKTLLLLSSFPEWNGSRPKMVGEITQKEKLEVARIAGQGTIPIISSSQIISKVVVQCSRQPQLSTVYSEIFSFAGSEIYIRPFPECATRRFGDILHAFSDAVPIGVSRSAEKGDGYQYEPVLNPGADYLIAGDEWLILMARNENCAFQPELPVPALPPLGTAEVAEAKLENILVLGWNNSLYDILSEYDEYVSPGTRVKVVSNYDAPTAMRRLEEFGKLEFPNLKLEFRRGNTVMRDTLEALNVPRYDCVVMLADESNGEGDPDARTIMSLVLLQDILSHAPGERRPQLVSELLDPRNRELIARANVNDIIVSPQVVSMLLAQISQQQMLTAVYDDLLSARGVEIYLKPAEHYVPLGELVSFGGLLVAAQRRNEIALGVCIHADRRDPAKSHGVQLNPPKEQSWAFLTGDRVIVLAQNLYG
jgi:ion channel POLLUX/CASTOR